MFGLFRRGPKAAPTPIAVPSTLQVVPVRRSTFEASAANPYGLIQDVINFINRMNDDGKFRGDEIPEMALQAYQTDYYLAQVCNGGHKQFVHNSGANYDTTIASVRAGLKAMGASEHLEVFEDMVALVAGLEHNQALDPVQEELSVLDDEFFALEKRSSLVGKNSVWIKSWPTLQVVDDEAHASVLQKTAQLNPLRDQRAEMRQIGGIIQMMQDPLRLMISHALIQCTPREMLCGIRHGTFHDLDGKDVMAITVKTMSGEVFAIADEEQGALSIHKKRKGKIGDAISRVQKADIDVFATHAAETNAAVALSFLFADAGFSLDGLLISPHPNGYNSKTRVSQWMLFTPSFRGALIAEFHHQGAFLLEMANTDAQIAMLRKADIDARFEALTSQL